jgi:di/tripeptidase
VQGLHWLKDLLSFLKSIFSTGIQIKKPHTKKDNINIDSTNALTNELIEIWLMFKIQ